MIKMMLYCDLSTMNCTSDDITKELEKFSLDYIQLNNSIWFFNYTDSFNDSPLSKDEYIFYEYFEKYLNEDSVILISTLNKNNYMYELPANINSFLQEL